MSLPEAVTAMLILLFYRFKTINSGFTPIENDFFF